MLNFYLTDQNRVVIGVMPIEASIDLDVGVDNDYQLTLSLDEYDENIWITGGYFFCPGTEYGGMLCSPMIDTASRTITWSGDTFRGMLSKKVTDPGSDDYLNLSGTSQSFITATVNQNNQYGTLFNAKGSTSIASATTRWETVLDCLQRICDYRDLRLDIKAKESSSGVMTVDLELVTVVDQSADIEYSQDQGFEFKIRNVTDQYTHVIALGKGELSARTVGKYSINKKGKLSSVSSIPAGSGYRVYVYDYSAAENTNQLQKAAWKKMKELNKKNEYSMTIPEDFDFQLGENVAGRDRITGTYVNSYVSRKTVKITDGTLSVSYQLK